MRACADSHYLDNSSRPQLVDAGEPFLCSIKSDCFKALTDCLQEKIKQPSEWYGLHNVFTTTRRIEMCYGRHCSKTHWSATNRRSNQDFVLVDLPNLSTHPASLNTMNSVVRLMIVLIYISVSKIWMAAQYFAVSQLRWKESNDVFRLFDMLTLEHIQ